MDAARDAMRPRCSSLTGFASARSTASRISASATVSPNRSGRSKRSEIRNILATRVGAENQGIGIVVGVIEPKGRRVIAYGSLAKDDKRPLNGDTVFEIGSMTKCSRR